MIGRLAAVTALALAPTLAATSAPPAHAAPDAGPSPPPAALRPAQAVLADFAKAIGGDAAAKHKTLHLRRELNIAAMGMSGNEERWAAAGDKMLAVMTIAGIGTIKQGSTGSVHW